MLCSGLKLYGYELAYTMLRALKSATSLEGRPVEGWTAEELHKLDGALLVQRRFGIPEPEDQD